MVPCMAYMFNQCRCKASPKLTQLFVRGHKAVYAMGGNRQFREPWYAKGCTGRYALLLHMCNDWVTRSLHGHMDSLSRL